MLLLSTSYFSLGPWIQCHNSQPVSLLELNSSAVSLQLKSAKTTKAQNLKQLLQLQSAQLTLGVFRYPRPQTRC